MDRTETLSPLPDYLQPYANAAAAHGGGFEALLWASRHTQRMRFDAIRRVSKLTGKTIVDAGCGRADLLDYLIGMGIRIDHYIGLEAIEELASAAERKAGEQCQIVRCDFVKDPKRLFAATDWIVFCGSLNTLDTQMFYRTIRRAFDAAIEGVAFNFLDSPFLAAASYLSWHPRAEVLAFAQTFSPRVQMLHDYLHGDCTISIRKTDQELHP
ncbi:MAG TPA: hypothetical protein VL282_12645 [Tepidisphaeraceae bacterium]|nr:hypothetical protein [Tepidisphaeraceae bacterium]